jgi:hypothetical protein
MVSSHTALANSTRIVSTLAYEIQVSSETSNAYLDVDGPVGSNSGKPIYADFSCGNYSGATYSGWTVGGTAAVRSYASEAASEADTRAPAVVGVKLTDQAGDSVQLTGGGVFDNNDDIFVIGSFKITYTPAGGTPTTCTITPAGGASGEAEMELP